MLLIKLVQPDKGTAACCLHLPETGGFVKPGVLRGVVRQENTLVHVGIKAEHFLHQPAADSPSMKIRMNQQILYVQNGGSVAYGANDANKAGTIVSRKNGEGAGVGFLKNAGSAQIA